MKSRLHHRIALTLDRDVLQVSAVALAATMATAGLLYVAYFAHVVRVARRAPIASTEADQVLLFGKFSPDGKPDDDFEARIARAVELHRSSEAAQKPVSWVLLGGGEPGQPSEAEIAHRQLSDRGVAFGAGRVHLEQMSRDTLQNLQNAREMLRAAGSRKVALLSSRYHLARCQIYARQLGFDSELLAAEPRLPWRWTTFGSLAGEAAYVMLSDIGARWARLTRNARILKRVT
jgi:vancomycin permeability regulator SanA